MAWAALSIRSRSGSRNDEVVLSLQTSQNGIDQFDDRRWLSPVRDRILQLTKTLLHLAARGTLSDVRAEFLRQFLLPEIEELLQPVFKIKTGHGRNTSMDGILGFLGLSAHVGCRVAGVIIQFLLRVKAAFSQVLGHFFPSTV